MAGTVTIKDSTTVMYQFPVVKNVMHNFEVRYEQYDIPGSTDPAVDHQKTVIHTITVEFELTDQGTYDPGQNKGTTGTIWKQKSFLIALKGQPSTNDYYTLIDDDDTEEASGWNGIVQKIITERAADTKPKMVGTLLFVETSDVLNF